ncbi:MAG: type II toxin-antitoxin system HicB family antitoxin [Desulfobacterales bacterium]
MKKIITSEICHDGEYYCARCMDFDVFTQGKTIDEAVKNLKEALALHFEDDSDAADIYDPVPSLFGMMDLGQIHVWQSRAEI